MTTFAVANLKNVTIGPAIVEYLERIDATLAPFSGRFVVHGGEPEYLEGTWEGTLVVIAFPDRRSARDWYDSPAYRAILPLRTGNADSEAFLIDTVEDGHRATDVLDGVSGETPLIT